MRTPVSIQREIIRLITKSTLSNRAAANIIHVTHKTIGSVRSKLKLCNLSPVELLELNDIEFQKQLGTNLNVVKSDRILPDWLYIQKQLQLNNMTRTLLWEEYRYENRHQLEKCIGSSRFAQLYRKWIQEQKICMRQLHNPGEKMFIDFCGQEMNIINKDTDVVSKAFVFVGALGASGYLYAKATPSMTSDDWIRGTVGAFEYFEGVTQQIVPDNPKATVIQNTKSRIIINRAFSEFAQHYDVIVNPARPGMPKDKAKAEQGVRTVQEWILAPLRNHVFYTIDELNREILHLLSWLNQRQTDTYPDGRLALFNRIEKSALSPLPIERYEPAEWIYKVRVPNDYHIPYEGCYYSVPYQHIKKLVDLRITERVIEILLEGKRIATHELLTNWGGISRNPEHMTVDHLYQSQETPEMLLEWAKEMGPSVFEWAIRNIKDRSDYANGIKSVSNLRKWVRLEQNHNRLESACAFALQINAIPFQRLQNIINKNSDLRVPIEKFSKVINHENIRGADYYNTEVHNNVE